MKHSLVFGALSRYFIAALHFATFLSAPLLQPFEFPGYLLCHCENSTKWNSFQPTQTEMCNVIHVLSSFKQSDETRKHEKHNDDKQKKNSIKIPHKQPQPKHPIMCYPITIPEKCSGIQCSISLFSQMVAWSIAKERLFAFTANDIIALSLCSPFPIVVYLRNSHCFKRTEVRIEQIIIWNISFGLLFRSKESSILYAPLIDY